MAGLVMGCVEGGGSASGTQGQTSASTSAFRAAGGRDVEAPEVFQVTDSGLWDGRPSLGGVWIASPDAVDPERVVIVNPATGKSVNGALFRRERDNPGPPLQISSDAAEALGILAGQPTTIRVTALRKRDEAPPAPETTPEAAAETTAVAAATPAEAATDVTEGEAIAAAALAATGAAVAGDGAEAAPEAAAAAEGTVEAAAEPAKPKTWKERRAEAKARREAEKAAKATAAAEAAAKGTEAAAGAAAEPAATAANAAVAAVESAPLDARTPEVTAAADANATTAAEAPAEPRKTRRQLREEREAAAAAAAEAPAAETPAADPAAGRSIQIASFSKEANAARAVETLAKIGISGQILQTERNGQTVWSVVTRGDEAQLTAIRGAGFADAFFLR